MSCVSTARARRLVVRRLRHLRLPPRKYGQDRVGAINFVAGAAKLGDSAFGTLIGPGFLDHFADATSDDLPTGDPRHARAWSAPSGGASRTRMKSRPAFCSYMVVPAGSGQAWPPASSTSTTSCARSRSPLVVSHGPIGHGRAASDGGACSSRPAPRRRCPGTTARPRPASGGAGTLQPRAGRAYPPRPGLTARAQPGGRARDRKR